ncbi:asparagine synthase (glutamine-hydrolyzing) [Hamadaea flava]|uniref:Asparagine synthase (Glutamine-hydrolysing) n=1 Tax=Hamadaea flava TaxID=1742688 RepID=A0ABV8LJ49_9ACTN|nr:hypothetical protein [Hamadaea flava]MCP2325083.1 asparagine synthase (glutamine-hydrolyzing) [Hamadaea flava]
MRAFLAVALAPHANDRFRQPSPAALACLTDTFDVGFDGVDVAIDRTEVTATGWTAFAGTEEFDRFGESGFTVRLSRLLRTREADLSTSDLAAMMLRPSSLVQLLPPFAAAHRSEDGVLRVATDWLGYRQLYWWQGHGVVAVSTSARALAVLSGAGLDRAGLGAQAMIGWQIGDRTPFAGVRAMPPASIATLQDGAIRIDWYADPFDQTRPVPSLDAAVDEMAAILSTSLSVYLEAHPEAVLQLTGGHDSRILLGAVPEKQRRGLRALTLGEDTSPDVMIAAKLSERYGLRHQVLHLDDVADPTPEEAHRLALRAARALECQASPMALGPLLGVEARLAQGHRLSGLGGEVARGFYYAGQPVGAETSAKLVDRLAHWRIFANEAVEEAALDPDFRAEALTETLGTLTEIFEPGDWLRATDAFYLYHRMHRWSGAHGTVAAVRRDAVNPMFDHRFIELALAVAPGDKRESLLLGRLMNRLDPELARIPLDTGLTPARLGVRDLSTRVAIATVTARQVARKVRQRLAHGRRAQFGAASFADLVLSHWRTDPSACAALYDQPVLRRDWLDGLLAGTHSAEATTVAYLVNLLALPQPASAK